MRLDTTKRRRQAIGKGLVLSIFFIFVACILNFNSISNNINVQRIMSGLITLDSYRAPRALPVLYPNAREVRQVTRDRGDNSNLSEGIVTFLTSDAITSVQTFYQDYMGKAGWDFGFNTAHSSNTLAVASFEYEGFDSPRYTVDITVTKLAENLTSVEIRMFAGGSTWHGSTLH